MEKPRSTSSSTGLKNSNAWCLPHDRPNHLPLQTEKLGGGGMEIVGHNQKEEMMKRLTLSSLVIGILMLAAVGLSQAPL